MASDGVKVAGDQVVCTFGGKHAIYAAMQVLIDAGDKVLIPSPYWVSYPEMVRLASGTPVFLAGHPRTATRLRPSRFSRPQPGRRC